jgi:nitrous oxidase accessory protein
MRAGVVALALVAVAASARHKAAVTPAATARDVGPRALVRPADAVVARDSDELRALLADAAGPRSIWLAPRVYRGDLRVTRPVTIAGAPGATLEGSGTATVLEIAADDVTVDNLTIRGSGHRHTHEDSAVKARGARIRLSRLALVDNLFGANLQSCHGCVIDAIAVHGPGGGDALRGDGIKLWEADDSVVRGSLVEDSRDVVVWYSRRVRLERNTLRRNRYGTHFMYAHDSSVHDCEFRDNVVGVFVMYSAHLQVERVVLAGARGAAGVGIGFKDSDGVAVRDSWIVANTTGVYLDRTPRSPADPVTFASNVLALNGSALRLHSSERGAAFEGNDFRDNVETVTVDGGGDALGMRFTGNYWSEYAGYDLDHDGRGDVAFAPRKMISGITDAHPSVRFFAGTAALALVDVVARAVPVLSARPLLEDGSPRMEPR